jgi:hypothetical protein
MIPQTKDRLSDSLEKSCHRPIRPGPYWSAVRARHQSGRIQSYRQCCCSHTCLTWVAVHMFWPQHLRSGLRVRYKDYLGDTLTVVADAAVHVFGQTMLLPVQLNDMYGLSRPSLMYRLGEFWTNLAMLFGRVASIRSHSMLGVDVKLRSGQTCRSRSHVYPTSMLPYQTSRSRHAQSAPNAWIS